jgi:hypothetical protein
MGAGQSRQMSPQVNYQPEMVVQPAELAASPDARQDHVQPLPQHNSALPGTVGSTTVLPQRPVDAEAMPLVCRPPSLIKHVPLLCVLTGRAAQKG